jgi:hypothetical protein
VIATEEWVFSRVAVRSPFGDQRSRSWSLEIYGQFAPIARSFMKWSIADRYCSNRSPKHCISGMTPLSIKTITNLVTQLFPVTSSARFWWIIAANLRKEFFWDGDNIFPFRSWLPWRVWVFILTFSFSSSKLVMEIIQKRNESETWYHRYGNKITICKKIVFQLTNQ